MRIRWAPFEFILMIRKLLLPICVLTFCSAPSGAQTLSGCGVFPANHVWNTPVDGLPLDSNSATYVNTIGAAKGMHADFSSTGYGLPFIVVPGTQPKVPITI